MSCIFNDFELYLKGFGKTKKYPSEQKGQCNWYLLQACPDCTAEVGPQLAHRVPLCKLCNNDSYWWMNNRKATLGADKVQKKENATSVQGSWLDSQNSGQTSAPIYLLHKCLL